MSTFLPEILVSLIVIILPFRCLKLAFYGSSRYNKTSKKWWNKQNVCHQLLKKIVASS
jgi:hypothetical protein